MIVPTPLMMYACMCLRLAHMLYPCDLRLAYSYVLPTDLCLTLAAAFLAHAQLPALQAFVSATAALQRMSGFKAGAELVRCLQEAKDAAAKEEEEMMRDVHPPNTAAQRAPAGAAGKELAASTPTPSGWCRFCSCAFAFLSSAPGPCALGQLRACARTHARTHSRTCK